MEEERKPAQEIAPIVMPAVSTQKALEAWKAYEDLKAKVVTKNDVLQIQGKDFLKKSYWRKIATFFNLSLELISEDRQQNGSFFNYRATYRAIAPNGRFVYGDGACSSDEKGLIKSEHNTRAIAHTRAFNRAVSNLVGGGEVSAEEVSVESYHEEPQKTQSILINEPQVKRFYAICKGSKIPDDLIHTHLKKTYGIESAKDIKREWYEMICGWAQNWKPEGEPHFVSSGQKG